MEARGEGFLDPWFLLRVKLSRYSFLCCQPKFGKIVRDSLSAINQCIIFLSFLSFLHYLNVAICIFWIITVLDFRVKVKSLGTMLPVCYPAYTLVEAFTVLWISVKPRGFPIAKVLVI